jgi:uncharacterized protein
MSCVPFFPAIFMTSTPQCFRITHRFTTAAMLCLYLLSQIGCGVDPRQAAVGRLKAMKASDYFTDPLQRQLAEAVQRGDQKAIDNAVLQGAKVNSTGKDGLPLLLWALAKQNLVGFESLLKHGADLKANVRDPSLTPPGQRTERVIELVVAEPDTAYLQAAMQSGFSPDFVADADARETLLFRTIDGHVTRSADILVATNANIDHTNWATITPMAHAQEVNYYEMVWFLLERGADPTIKDKWGYDIAANIKQYGTRGVFPEQMPFFDKVVAELEKRGLITRQDIVNADKPKNGSGVKTIVHPPDSEIGKAIREMDKAEQEAIRRDAQQRP